MSALLLIALAAASSEAAAAPTGAPPPPAASGPVNVPQGPVDTGSVMPDQAERIQLSASTAGGQAAFSLTRTISEADLGIDGRGTGVETSFTFGAQAPLDEDADFTRLATLDGLADDVSIKFGVSVFKVGIGTPTARARARVRALERKAISDCRAKPQAKPESCDPDKTDLQTILTGHLSREEHSAYLSEYHPRQAALAAGFSGRVGFRRFHYLDPATAEEEELGRVSWTGGGFLTVLPNFKETAITFAAEYQRSFEAAEEGTLCAAPAAPGAPAACTTGALGRPETVDKLLLSAELRSRFATGAGLLPWVGVSPRFTYDALDDRIGIDVPVYLVGDGQGGLSGGVRGGWTNKGGGFVAGVFVGSSFSLF